MTLDVCPPPDSDFALVRQATERTFRWAERCQQAHQSSSSALYGIVQGGTFPALRHQSSEEIVSLNFDGYGIGGLSLGERKELTWATLEATESLLPWDKPRYLMGVGSPEDILEGVARGVDIFDSALPTRVARNGALFTSQGRCNIRNASFKEKETPIDPHCSCYTCCHFSAAYLHHLFKCEELLAYRLATIHNLFFIIKLTEQIRETILEGKFDRFRRDFLSHYQTVDEKRRLAEKRRWLHR
jgi:queuine tRNA-ribosyltransferase